MKIYVNKKYNNNYNMPRHFSSITEGVISAKLCIEEIYTLTLYTSTPSYRYYRADDILSVDCAGMRDGHKLNSTTCASEVLTVAVL